jgi:hypothetical protein
MNIKLFKRLTVIFLCIAMVLGFFPFTQSGTNVYAAAQDVNLTNSDFEAEQPLSGWTVEDSSGSIAISTAVVHGGANSLEMLDTGSTQSPFVRSEIIPVKAGDKITASVFANVSAYDGTAAYVDAIFSIWYCDAGQNRIGQAYGPDIQANGGWTQYTSPEITIPAQVGGVDVAGICVAMYGAGGGECRAYFDDVKLYVETTQAPVDTGNIVNPGFEEAVGADGSIPGWEMDDGATSENFMVTTAESYNSSTSLKMADPGAGSSPWLYSNKIDANPGDKVTLTAHVKVEAGGYAELSILYIDGNGNWIYPYENVEIGACDWSEKSITGTVPQGAVAVRAFIWSGNAAATTAYFDDVNLKIDAELFQKVIFSSDCSNLVDMRNGGWFIDDPYEGLYTTDNTHSTGTSVGNTPIREVPEGQLLFYMDNTSGADAVGAFKKVDNSDIIGQNPWKLELDMNLQALMTANTPNVDSGFSVIIDIGEAGKVYRVNFGGDGVIRALTDTGFKQQAADLYIGDGKIHHWTLEGDSDGNLVITCDGSSIATFSDVMADGSWGESGVHFVEYNNDISAGSCEVYFDNIKLSIYTENPGTGVTAGIPVDLGAAVMGGKPLFLYSIIEKNTVTGNDELYTVTTGSQDNSSVFYAIDPATGEMLFSQQISGTVHNYGIVKGSDNNIYFGGVDDGKLYRYIPGAKGQGRIEELGTNPSSTWIWDLVASDDGKIYGVTSQTDGGTDNGSKVFEYDIATGTFKDLGSAKAGAVYARGLGVVGEYLYVGVGIPDSLIRINRADPSQKMEISIPAFGDIPGTGTDGRMCGHVWAYNGKLFVRDNAMKLFVLDENSYELLNVLSFQQAISSPSPYNSNIIYYKSKNAIWQYDCSTNTAKQVDNSPVLSADASNALDWFTPSVGAKAGRQLLGITDDAGGFVVYDPQDNTAVDSVLGMNTQAIDIQSIEKGPDGKLYIGGYQFGGSVFDTSTKTIIYNAPKLDQPEGIGFLNGKVYFGTYGSAMIYSYDPSKPFNYNSGTDGNPGLAYDIGNDQDRPFVLTSGDNKLFVGTVPDYGMLGGALTIYDEKAGTWSEYRNVITDQSITGLAYKDGKLYGGTSIAGGIGVASTGEQAKIFVWDVAKGEKVKEATINIPGLNSTFEKSTRTTPVMIGSLTFGKDGLLWGAADGALFALNPDTLEVVKSKVLTSMNYDSDSAWRPFYLRWGADGLLYTTIGRKVTVFNTVNMGYTILNGYAGLATLGNDGNIYYASGSKLMMLPINRQDGNAEYAKGVAVNAANDAIDMLPGYYNITLANKTFVSTARTLVNSALSAGAAENDICNLDKLVKCEETIASLEKSALDAAVNAIVGLPDQKHIKLSDKADVEAARVLTDAALAAGFTAENITGYQKLLNCEKKIALLQKAEELNVAIKSANKAISALPNVVRLKLTDKPAVQEARRLTDIALSLGAKYIDIPNYYKLMLCEAKIKLLELIQK